MDTPKDCVRSISKVVVIWLLNGENKNYTLYHVENHQFVLSVSKYFLSILNILFLKPKHYQKFFTYLELKLSHCSFLGQMLEMLCLNYKHILCKLTLFNEIKWFDYVV